MATPIFSYMKAKHILMCSFLLNGLALVLFTLSADFFLLAASRFLVGFCQVSLSRI
jgi:predicted MFS family arabinose efflux permease